MIDWSLNPEYATDEAGTLFGDIDRVFSLTGELITDDSLSRVLRVTVGGKRYYVNDPRLSDRRSVARVSRQVADIARTLHAAHFAHNDLKWHNLLVDGESTVYLIDCPSGGHYRGAVLDCRITKDLVCLDILARQRLSRSQRLRFYLDYTQKPRLTDQDRQRIRKVVGFFGGRQPRWSVAPANP